MDSGRGSIKRAFQPLIKPRLKAKPSRPGQSRLGGFPLSLWSLNPMSEGGVPATRFDSSGVNAGGSREAHGWYGAKQKG
ncbi:hypothetical protein ERO13_A11G293905v2 [Gossypium hirsutum]|nr:hypothetical protein ERO13_A11G293905v2 [Gossypium hirsutum]